MSGCVPARCLCAVSNTAVNCRSYLSIHVRRCICNSIRQPQDMAAANIAVKHTIKCGVVAQRMRQQHYSLLHRHYFHPVVVGAPSVNSLYSLTGLVRFSALPSHTRSIVVSSGAGPSPLQHPTSSRCGPLVNDPATSINGYGVGNYANLASFDRVALTTLSSCSSVLARNGYGAPGINDQIRLCLSGATLPFGSSSANYSQIRCLHTSQILFADSPSNRTKVEQTLETLKEELKRESGLSSAKAEQEKAISTGPKKSLWQRFVDELKHYYHGFRLLFADVRIASGLSWRAMKGKTLSRREHRQLIRTVSDLFRLVPFLVFIIVPFMEVLLPIALKLFPGMLPSTFQEASKEEEKVRRQLKVRLEMAKFLRATLGELSLNRRKSRDGNESLSFKFSEFMEKIREERYIPSNEELLKFSKVFEDELTLDNLSVGQLRAVCRIVGITPIGPPNLLRLQLNLKLRELKADDKLILKEGVENLTVAELQTANRARGMRALGLNEERLRTQLKQWLELSMNEQLPPSLLLLSRTLYLPSDIPFESRLKTILSQLPGTVAEECKLKLSEWEGDKIDNKAKLDVVLAIDEALKRERAAEEKRIKDEEEMKKAEQLKKEQELTEKERLEAEGEAAKVGDIAAPLGDKAPEAKVAMDAADASAAVPDKDKDEVKAEEIRELEQVLESVSTIEDDQTEFQELKENVQEYVEDVQQIQALTVLKGESTQESKAAKRLRSRVDGLIAEMTGLLSKLQDEGTDLKRTEASSSGEGDLVTIDELMQSLRRIQKVPDDAKQQKILEVLRQLDDDHDGKIDIDLAFDVIEILGRENVKVSSAQMQQIINMLKKEEILEKVKDADRGNSAGGTDPSRRESLSMSSSRSTVPSNRRSYASSASDSDSAFAGVEKDISDSGSAESTSDVAKDISSSMDQDQSLDRRESSSPRL